MMSMGLIPLDTPRTNAHLYFPSAHKSGGQAGGKEGDIMARGGFLRAENVIGILLDGFTEYLTLYIYPHFGDEETASEGQVP